MAQASRPLAMQLSDLGWVLMSEPDEILPLNDTRDHRGGLTCWCNPDLDDADTIVHNAADGREAYVEQRRKPH
jgi:hypothetical protein